MRNLEMVANECIVELNDCNIRINKVKEIKVNNRAKNRLGICRRINGEYIIEISDILLSNNVPLKSLKQTILHELLHTCDGCMNHKEKWKRYANIVNKKYGYNISRVTNMREIGIDIDNIDLGYKYKATCKCCGQVIKRKRKSDFIKHPNFYTCGKCCTSD